ncbi:MAG: FliH/SctL family protein [Maricaulis sp.]|jgi:flagellar assembly protein FliH|nr:FliH/SctL family protein [Maricaulis sp.]MDG2044322.1 FliH/SctL family protein [Maricaulis sp.]
MKPTKFDFDTEFDEDGTILREGESYKRFFTQDDIDAARMWGVEEGREEEEGRCAEALLAISAQMQIILSRLGQESESLRQEAAKLALISASKISGAALENFPVATIDELVSEAMGDLRTEPRFSVRCTPDLVDAVAQRLEKTARDAGFDGAIKVRGDAGLAAADLRLDWASGSVQRSASEIEVKIHQIIERWLVAGPALQDTVVSDDSGNAAGASAA